MSKIRRIIQIALLIIVVGSVSYLIAKEMLHGPHNEIAGPSVADSETNLKASVRPDHVVAYYFHGNFRCANCRKIEAYSKESINSNFPNELKNGLLSFKIVNVEEPENRHFIQDYGLYTKSLVVVSYAGNEQIRYKNLEGVWKHLNSKKDFEDYVESEMSGFLSEVKK